MTRRLAGTVASALVISLVLSLGLGGCTSVKAGLGTRDSICFAALPQAQRAIGTPAKFAGVRYLSPVDLLSAVKRARRRHIVPPDALVDIGRRGACLIGYRGRFQKSDFPSAWVPGAGPYRFAIVIVRQDDHQVVGVVLLSRPLLRFFHLS
jgi:hypothetical protein